MASIKVFGSPASTEVARVLACLLEKDVDFQLIRMDTYKGEHKVPEFIKLQDPSGQVTYQDGEKTLFESREICRYISEKYGNKGNKKLLGTGTLERASIEQWLQAEECNFHPPSSKLVFHLGYAPQMNQYSLDPDFVHVQERKLGRVLDVYEDRLSETEYLAGDEFSLADLSHLPNSHYLNKTARGRKLFASRKNVNRWWDSISSRASWKMVAQMQGSNINPAGHLDY